MECSFSWLRKSINDLAVGDADVFLLQISSADEGAWTEMSYTVVYLLLC